MNQVFLYGRLVRKPEHKQVGGKAVANFSLALNGPVDPKTMKAKVDFIECEVWGGWADNLCKTAAKGSWVLIEGRLQQARWEKDGKAQSRVRVVARTARHVRPQYEPREGEASVEVDADIPF